ncbi:MAG: nitrate reductase molybdenum cofactor assembly chaperone [Actinomycetales bacterium]
MRRRRRGTGARYGDAEVATAWQVISLLLDYPDRVLLTNAPALREVATRLPTPVGSPLVAFLDGLDGVDGARLGALQAEYVRTFDTSRRCCLYLSYFTHGDTRKRGVALVRFKQAYRRAGVECSGEELPDHLSVVLEFGACHDLTIAWQLLEEHRVGIEVLARALAERGSQWELPVRALLATLPELAGDDQQRILTLIRRGPPTEEVGMDSTAPYLVPPSAPDPRTPPAQVVSLADLRSRTQGVGPAQHTAPAQHTDPTRPASPTRSGEDLLHPAGAPRLPIPRAQTKSGGPS